MVEAEASGFARGPVKVAQSVSGHREPQPAEKELIAAFFGFVLTFYMLWVVSFILWPGGSSPHDGNSPNLSLLIAYQMASMFSPLRAFNQLILR